MTYKSLGEFDSTPDQHTGLLAEWKRYVSIGSSIATTVDEFAVERVRAMFQDFEAKNVIGTLKERCIAEVDKDVKSAAARLGVDIAIDTDVSVVL